MSAIVSKSLRYKNNRQLVERPVLTESVRRSQFVTNRTNGFPNSSWRSRSACDSLLCVIALRKGRSTAAMSYSDKADRLRVQVREHHEAIEKDVSPYGGVCIPRPSVVCAHLAQASVDGSGQRRWLSGCCSVHGVCGVWLRSVLLLGRLSMKCAPSYIEVEVHSRLARLWWLMLCSSPRLGPLALAHRTRHRRQCSPSTRSIRCLPSA
jgi:hypothetical protein